MARGSTATAPEIRPEMSQISIYQHAIPCSSWSLHVNALRSGHSRRVSQREMMLPDRMRWASVSPFDGCILPQSSVVPRARQKCMTMSVDGWSEV